MKKVVNTFFAITVVFLLLGGVTVQAQKIDFEDKTIGDTYAHIGWSASDITAEVADDPLATGNNVLKCTINNYNAAPVLEVTLPAGKTLADYGTFKFKGYFAQGDVGWKDIVVEAYQTMPTGQFGNVAGNAIGKWNRAKGGSTAWEDISIGITGSASLTGTIYLAFGINCNGTGDIGGTGVTTIWYADDIELVLAPYVTQWGKTAQGTAWPILWNDSDYAAGDAGIGDGEPPTGWATIKGGFPTLEATTSQAVVVTGEMELVGGGGASAYTWLRYGLTYQDSVELKYQGTDSATWVTTADSASNQNKHFGYLFTPVSGMGTMSNSWRAENGGAGTVWLVNNGSWNSTNNPKSPTIAAVKQAPRNAVAIAGTYKFAISVQPKDETTNEIRWYLIEKNNKYWFGGTVIDTTAITTKFNGICFGFNNDIEATQVNFYDVKVDLGAPITVPEAPWEAYYVDQWGKTAQGTAWPILWNDSDYAAGDAGIGDGERPTGWATIKGGFGDPIQATTSKAIIVTGEMELVGGGGASAYTWLRYGLTYQDSVELKYQGTDSATWVTTADSASNQNKHFGYLFTPVSGMGTMSNSWRAENGGAGTVWLVNNGSWNSTNNPKSPTIAAVKQAPRNAVAIAGTYKFAISVQPKDETTNEIRWYLIEKNNKYWFGGTVIDTTAITTKFNGICFGFNNDIEATQVNFYKVKVDLGAPITVPEAPWEAYYVSQWGFSGGNLGGWDLIPGDMEGDVEISGTAAPTGWVALRGGFDRYELNETYALKISGQIELVGGGFQDAGSLRYGIFYSDSAGTTWQDSTLDSNWVWKGTDNYHSGYLITPPSGSNVATWSNGSGTWGSVTNGKWWDISAPSAHVLGNIAQDPVGGVAGAGIYDFTISISKGTSGNLLVFTLSKKDGTYYYAHSTTTPVASVTDEINSIGFAINNSTTTALKLYKVKVDRGDHFNGLEEAIAAQLPKAYALKQNYPNPFNPTTNIRFDLPKDSDVNLVVYDLMGREVAKLVNGPMNAGYYTINFNAANLPSGVYIYRLKAGDFVSTKKLMLLK